jgi:hypothetical protein
VLVPVLVPVLVLVVPVLALMLLVLLSSLLRRPRLASQGPWSWPGLDLLAGETVSRRRSS